MLVTCPVYWMSTPIISVKHTGKKKSNRRAAVYIGTKMKISKVSKVT